jgi:putative ABC transport system ATP-binding protein
MSANSDVDDADPVQRSRDGESLALRLTGVSKTYGSGPTRVIALHGVDLEVRTGELVSLSGPAVNLGSSVWVES